MYRYRTVTTHSMSMYDPNSDPYFDDYDDDDEFGQPGDDAEDARLEAYLAAQDDDLDPWR